ncbi:hypothetical protein GCM10027187_39900 [Streptosporangium sandarakinum]|uniref:Uncharacterized protein n=1 Tax=Streptosporangium sandarakinum TaxID=1260955 RepID=A0A852V881_9ACTN|nr:hypothetical protein [Streptosporangium sandarakinum]NYF44679.1 hypothetical protein [Streptosporangium sandarakinum]
MTDLESVDLELLAGFAAKIDPFMQGVLVSGDVEQIRGFVLEAAWNCTERPYFEHLWGVGGLYRVWMGIDDIFDGWPVDHGADADALAMREFRLAAQEWLDMPRTETGFRHYVHRWERRVAEDTWPAPGGAN